MAYTFDVVAWQGWDDRRWSGVPDNPQDAKGLKVVATNGESHQFWAFTLTEFQDFAEWWVYVGGLMVRYGMPLEDDSGGGPPIEPPDYDDEEPEDEGEDEEPPAKPGPIRRVIRWLFGRR